MVNQLQIKVHQRVWEGRTLNGFSLLLMVPATVQNATLNIYSQLTLASPFILYGMLLKILQ